MPTYKFRMTEQIDYVVEVEAEDADEAWDKCADVWADCYNPGETFETTYHGVDDIELLEEVK